MSFSQLRGRAMRSAALISLSFIPSALTYCLPPGGSLPPPSVATAPSESIIPDSAWASFEDIDTTFAIKATIGDTEIYNYDYIYPAYNHSNIGVLNTQMRLGSVTKVMTVLAVILSADKMALHDPIRKYVPELAGEVWDHVTLANLADHTAGTSHFGYVGDWQVDPSVNKTAFGLPAVNDTTFPNCDPFPGGRDCTYDEVIDMFNHPAQLPNSPNHIAAYSNPAFNLLGMALAKAHGKPYEEVIQELIIDPIGLNHTSFITPNDTSSAILPRTGEQWFVSSFGNYNPTGGLWSTPNELMKFFRAVANNEYLCAAETRNWLRPTTVLPSLHQLVGQPWEILRPDDLNLTYPRVVDIYEKSGGVTGYTSYGIIVPEFDLVVTINAAGKSSNAIAMELIAVAMQSLIPYADKVAREQATASYVGTYVEEGTNNTISFEVDDGPGIAISEWNMNGIPILSAFAGKKNVTLDEFSARVFPTDPDSLGTEKEYWLINMDTKTTKPSWSDTKCIQWMQIDKFRYVRETVDAVQFVKEGDDVVAVELGGWRATLKKQS